MTEGVIKIRDVSASENIQCEVGGGECMRPACEAHDNGIGGVFYVCRYHLPEVYAVNLAVMNMSIEKLDQFEAAVIEAESLPRIKTMNEPNKQVESVLLIEGKTHREWKNLADRFEADYKFANELWLSTAKHRDEWKSRAENEAKMIDGFKAVIDQIIDIVSPEPGSRENVVVAVRRVVSERDSWKEVADALLKCATEDATCDEWNKAFAAHLAAIEGTTPK